MGGFVFVVVLACVGFVAFCAFICLGGFGGLGAILSCTILLCEGLCGVVFVGLFCAGVAFWLCGLLGLSGGFAKSFDCIISLPFCAFGNLNGFDRFIIFYQISIFVFVKRRIKQINFAKKCGKIQISNQIKLICA